MVCQGSCISPTFSISHLALFFGDMIYVIFKAHRQKGDSQKLAINFFLLVAF